MWTGRQTLTSLEQTIARLQGEEGRLDEALRSAHAEAERLREERGEALRQLARVKLDELAAGRLVANLDAAERKALQILEDNRLRIETLADRRSGLTAEIARAEAARNEAAGLVERALEAVEAVRADAEARAAADPAWREVSSRHDAAEKIAAEAEKKAETNEAELSAKRKPYDSDPLFVYLWRRGWGTPAYASSGLTRTIDGLVARFIGYTDARANYAMLIEIPKRLREHATRTRTAAEAAKSERAVIERRALVEAGVDAREKALAQARHKLASADDVLEKKRSLLNGLEEEHARLLNGGGEAYARALATIAEADAAEDIRTLLRDARRTATEEDERAVERISTIDERLSAIDRELRDLRKSALEIARRRDEVERARQRFRGAGYDHPHATFRNERDITEVLESIATGVVRSGILWELLRAGFGMRKPKGRAGFGGPSFPFPFPIPGGGDEGPRGGGWRDDPASRGGWFPPGGFGGGGGGSDRDRSRDDGFSTGGSF